MEPFSIATARAGKVFIVRTIGYLDVHGGADLAQAVEKGFAEGFQDFVIDFSRSPVVNSQGTTRILEIVDVILDKRKGRIAFSGLSDLAKRLLQMVGLFLRVSHHPDEAAAVASLQ